jgi:uncharacterized membrane protein
MSLSPWGVQKGEAIIVPIQSSCHLCIAKPRGQIYQIVESFNRKFCNESFNRKFCNEAIFRQLTNK